MRTLIFSIKKPNTTHTHTHKVKDDYLENRVRGNIENPRKSERNKEIEKTLIFTIELGSCKRKKERKRGSKDWGF